MNRGIDHLVLCVHDLEAARARYGALGFTTTPTAQHPFGTANSLVQLQGNFLELLAVAEPAKIPPAEPGHFSFGAFNAGYAARRQGLSMLVFQSEDARRDQAEFAEKGLDTYAPFDFSRRAALPDGSEVTVSFSLAFVTDPRMPEAAFFTCQQHAPEHFWKPDYQRHPNGATAIVEVVLVAPEPAELAGFFGGLLGQVSHDGSRLEARTALGRVTVLTPRDFAARFADAGPDDLPDTPHLAAFAVSVPNLTRAARLLRDGGTPYRRAGDRLQVAAARNFGAVLEIVES